MTTPEDPEVQDAIRALLRSDPIDIDPDRREQAIGAALDAAAEALPTQDATVSPMRSRGRAPMRPLLVAAALVLVVAGGAVASSQWSDSGEDAATGAAATAGAQDDAAHGEGTQESADAESAGEGADSRAEAAYAAGTGVALGEFDDVTALFDAADRAVETQPSAPDEGVATTPAPLHTDAAASTTELECEPAPRGAPVASATLSGRPVVVVIEDDRTLVVIAVADCSEVARR